MERGSLVESKKISQSVKEYYFSKLNKNYDLDLSSCKEPYQKAILNYEPGAIPSFLSQQFNQQNQTVKEIKSDDLITERIFYYNYLKLCFETNLEKAQIFLGKIEEFFQTNGFQLMFPDHKDPRFYNTQQFQKLIYEFLNKIADAQFTVEEGLIIYPIIDQALTYFFFSASEILDGQNNSKRSAQGFVSTSEQQLQKDWKDLIIVLSKIFQIEVTVFQEGLYFSDTDLWIYEESSQNGSRFFIIQNSTPCFQKAEYCFTKTIFDCEEAIQRPNNNNNESRHKLVSEIQIQCLDCVQVCQSEQIIDNISVNPNQNKNQENLIACQSFDIKSGQQKKKKKNKEQDSYEDQTSVKNDDIIRKTYSMIQYQIDGNQQSKQPTLNSSIVKFQVSQERQNIGLVIVPNIIQVCMTGSQKQTKQFIEQSLLQNEIIKVQCQASQLNNSNHHSDIFMNDLCGQDVPMENRNQQQQPLNRRLNQTLEESKDIQIFDVNQILKLKKQIKQQTKTKKRRIKVLYREVLKRCFPPLMNKQKKLQHLSQNNQKKIPNALSGAETIDTQSKGSEIKNDKDLSNKGDFVFLSTFFSANSNQTKTQNTLFQESRTLEKQNAIPNQLYKADFIMQKRNQETHKSEQIATLFACQIEKVVSPSDEISMEFTNSSFAKILRPTNQLHLEFIKHRSRTMRKAINQYRMIV